VIKKLAEQFNKEGYQLYEVGGRIRDELLNRTSNDIDLATNALPSETRSILNNLGKVYTVGEEFGTIGLNVDDLKIEITTYRKEVYPSDSRKPVVTFGTSLRDDLARRDFNINAMARNPLNNEIIDYFGGLNDIKSRVIRCVGSDDRLNEDPLRMMRAIRFACQLGFKLDIKIDTPQRLSIISNERIRDELIKILLTDNASDGVRLLCDYGLMTYIIPEFMLLKDVAQGKNHIKDAYQHTLLVLDKGAKIDFGESNTVFRLACLLHDIAKPDTKTENGHEVHFYSHHYVGAKKANTILQGLRFDSDTIKQVCHLINYHMMPIMLQDVSLTDRNVRRMVYKIGKDTIYMLLSLVQCDIQSSSSPRHDFITKLTEMVDKCLAEYPTGIKSPLSGDEIMERFNIPPGKLVGEIKEYLTNLVIDDTLEDVYVKVAEFIERKGRYEIEHGKESHQ